MPKLASWNVNSLRVRLDAVLHWVETQHIDILALQETKLIDADFPVHVFHDKGWHVAFSGQKTYNGVAIISREPLSDIVTDVEGFVDPQRRILAATIGDLRLINLYVPNGAEVDSDKYQYKLAWLEHVTAWIQQQCQQYPRLAVVGDFNIAPDDLDVHDPILWKDQILVSPAERAAFFQLLTKSGLHDSFRLCHPHEQAFSWWDYRAARFQRGQGLRIDHILLTDTLCKQCVESQIDSEPRRAERPSDHAPVWISY